MGNNDSTLIILGALGIGAFALFKSDFFKNAGAGIKDFFSGLGSAPSGAENILSSALDNINPTIIVSGTEAFIPEGNLTIEQILDAINLAGSEGSLGSGSFFNQPGDVSPDGSSGSSGGSSSTGDVDFGSGSFSGSAGAGGSFAADEQTEDERRANFTATFDREPIEISNPDGSISFR